MPQINPQLSPLCLLFLLLTTTASAAPSFFKSYSQYKNVISLSHSLFTRVSNLRAARGDIAGANRAKIIAEKLNIGFWGSTWSLGYDYVKNYSWRDLNYKDLYDVVSEMNELARVLGELTRAESDVQRASWIARNYSSLFRIAKSVLQRLHKVFNKTGAFKEVVETLQREVVDGELLKDCIELGSYDLKGLIQIIKDLASQFYSSSENYNSDL
ncbi:uncharacterized protein LOC126682288 [Mercurialis annua]|uniref:uncharacterized protein LOC126682288 n=1 Tax=Mercurialis annua TaxID=3986 RepID=UPI00215FEBCF|nr:uncharacterized protein LOC126682288 [Mercurialis annua]